MCPICISTAAMALAAGAGSAGGLAALVAVKLRVKRQPDHGDALRNAVLKIAPQPKNREASK